MASLSCRPNSMTQPQAAPHILYAGLPGVKHSFSSTTKHHGKAKEARCAAGVSFLAFCSVSLLWYLSAIFANFYPAELYGREYEPRTFSMTFEPRTTPSFHW